MDKDRIEGSIKQAQGTVKAGVGKAVGNPQLEAEGERDKATGLFQRFFGRIKDAFRIN